MSGCIGTRVPRWGPDSDVSETAGNRAPSPRDTEGRKSESGEGGGAVARARLSGALGVLSARAFAGVAWDFGARILLTTIHNQCASKFMFYESS